jgi:hypothetical protein
MAEHAPESRKSLFDPPGPERPSQEVLFSLDCGLGMQYRQTGDEAGRAREVLQVNCPQAMPSFVESFAAHRLVAQ